MILDCKLCDKTFKKNHELETHVEEHHVEKNYKCNLCNKDFYLKWRLEKHISVHSENTKVCHYFSDKQKCPFEQIGCKFRHEDSDKTSQQFQYAEIVNERSASEKVVEETETENDSSDSDEEILENQCHLCMKQFNKTDDLGNHFKHDHIQFYTLMISRNQTKT